MDLKNPEKMRGGAAVLMMYALVVGVAALAGCSSSQDPNATGFVDRSETDCSPLSAPTVLAQAPGPYACRGGLHTVGGELIGALRPSSDAPFTLFALDKNGQSRAKQETVHRAEQTALLPNREGFTLASFAGNTVTLTHHTTKLGTTTKQAVLKKLKREVMAFGTMSVGSEDAAMVVAGTDMGVHLIQLDQAGAVINDHPLLTFPEMPYCAETFITREGGFWVVTLRCEAILPSKPVVQQGVARIAAYDDESDDLPYYTDVVMTLDSTSKVKSVALKRLDQEPPPPKASSDYALVQYITEQIPRPRGVRAFVLGVHRLKNGQLLHVSCVGSDASPAELQTGVLACEAPPE